MVVEAGDTKTSKQQLKHKWNWWNYFLSIRVEHKFLCFSDMSAQMAAMWVSSSCTMRSAKRLREAAFSAAVEVSSSRRRLATGPNREILDTATAYDTRSTGNASQNTPSPMVMKKTTTLGNRTCTFRGVTGWGRERRVLRHRSKIDIWWGIRKIDRWAAPRDIKELAVSRWTRIF